MKKVNKMWLVSTLILSTLLVVGASAPQIMNAIKVKLGLYVDNIYENTSGSSITFNNHAKFATAVYSDKIGEYTSGADITFENDAVFESTTASNAAITQGSILTKGGLAVEKNLNVKGWSNLTGIVAYDDIVLCEDI